MAKGRKRKTGNREKNGRPQRVKETDPNEVLRDAHKRKLVGQTAREIDGKTIMEDNDLTKGSCPIDIMVARGFINGDQERAAQIYENLKKFRSGSSHPGTVWRSFMAMGVLSGAGWDWAAIEDPEERAIRLTEKYHAAEAALVRAGEGYGSVMNAVENVVVKHRKPRWLRAIIYGLRVRKSSERQRLMKGLNALADVFGGKARRKAA